MDLTSLASVCKTFIAEAEQDLDSCTICLCALSAGEELIRVGCDARHVFHSQCSALPGPDPWTRVWNLSFGSHLPFSLR